ncbi:hypothetical protein OROGR_008870 [Orobanche gracilis]
MGMPKVSSAIFLFLVALESCNGGKLRTNFYRRSCPPAEQIVQNITIKHVATDYALPAKLLRMHFHDCFVRGCEGSVLIDSTRNNTAEKDAAPNKNSLKGFDVIDDIKNEVEKSCPGVVSCADILALAARDSVSMQFDKSMWDVQTGRKDGRISIASEALANIPSPFSNFTSLKQDFASKGLDVKDLVVLSGSGAHTIGDAHCNLFSNRLYNFTGKGDQDPSLNTSYAATLKSRCRSLSDSKTTVGMDPGSSSSFDDHYYSMLAQNKGLFVSDAALITDKVAKGYVDQMVVGSAEFLTEFGKSMKRMGAIEVLTGSGGEIRKNCRVIN